LLICLINGIADMSLIPVDSPQLKAKCLQDIECIRRVNTRSIDGNVIANLVLVCFYCGFRVEELIEMRVKDLLAAGGAIAG
jgi:hypothetical protein